MRIPIAVMLLVALAGCGATGGATAPTSSAAPTATASTPPAAATGAPTMSLIGVLSGDPALEGGCVWLDTHDGRIEVLWPDGYTTSATPVEVRDGAGSLVAAAGDVVRIEGAPAADRVSTCQVGELWVATAVGID